MSWLVDRWGRGIHVRIYYWGVAGMSDTNKTALDEIHPSLKWVIAVVVTVMVIAGATLVLSGSGSPGLGKLLLSVGTGAGLLAGTWMGSPRRDAGRGGGHR